jgi:hypothetical protein
MNRVASGEGELTNRTAGQSDRLVSRLRYLTAVGVILCLAQISSARADSASCIAKISSYVAELDELLSKERNWITPYEDLNKRYLPFRDCEADALLEVVSRSRFIQPIDHHPGLKEYFIGFSSDKVEVFFTYHVSKKRSDPDTNTVVWVHK